MNCIDLLLSQHREVDRLFEAIESGSLEDAYGYFESLADALAIHATIEEKIFYPAVKSKNTMDELKESVEEHWEMKKILNELMDSEPEDGSFLQKCKELKNAVQHHVKEEENELFPQVRQMFDARKLDQIGNDMMEMVRELESQGEPSENIPLEIDQPAQI